MITTEAAYLEGARKALKTGDKTRAEALFRQALAVEGNDSAKAARELATLLAESGRVKEALAMLDTVLHEPGFNISIWQSLKSYRDILSKKQKKATKPVTVAREAPDNKPDNTLANNPSFQKYLTSTPPAAIDEVPPAGPRLTEVIKEPDYTSPPPTAKVEFPAKSADQEMVKVSSKIVAAPREVFRPRHKLRGDCIVGSTLFYFDKSKGEFIGPWLVQTQQGCPWALPAFRNKSLQVYQQDAVRPYLVAGGDGHTYLTKVPEEVPYSLVDMADHVELAVWLEQLLQSAAPALIWEFGKSHPNWRRDLEKHLRTSKRPAETRLYLNRLERLQQPMEVLVRQEETFQKLIQENPTWATRFQNEVKKQVEALEDAVRREAEEKVLPGLQGRIESLSSELEVLEQLHRDKVAEIATLEEQCSIRQLEVPLPVPPSRSVATAAQTVRDWFQPSTAPLEEDLFDSLDFIFKRFWPWLSFWVPGATERCAQDFHLAVLACPMLLVPNAAMVRAYQLALGDSGRLSMVTSSPTWLDFNEAWNGGLEASWQAALEEPEVLHMLLFEEVDRSFVQSWARPLLNLRAGLIDCLKPEVYPGWPPNLRLFFRCAPDETTLQCPEELIKACGAVQIGLDESPEAPNPGEPPQDIATFPWVQWSQAGACPLRPDLRLIRLGAYHLCGSHDLARIRRLAALHSEDEATTDHFAMQVRIKWPSDYRRSLP